MEKAIMFLLFFVAISVYPFAQVGRVGINTATPAAMLHVKDSSVVFTGIVTPPGTGNPPISGAGTRMMWYPNKAAFRAGRVSGSDWDKDSIGVYSAAFGINNVAKGSSSFASGASNGVYGNQSTALGSFNKASGDQSFATGNNSVASGANSFTAGFNSVASGTSSAAFAQGKASGSSSFASGFESVASGNGSFAFGNGAYAKSFNSALFGRYNDSTSVSGAVWVATDPLFIIGNGVDANNRSNAITILKNAKTGINTTTPDAMLHVVRDAPTNGLYNGAATAIFEGDQGSFIQLSSDATMQSGVLAGSELTSLRSALIFMPDSSIQMRAGGGTTRLFVKKDGNIGIGTLSPQKKLHVSGGASGATPMPIAVGVFEDNSSASINLLTPAANESGIYFGNPTNAASGGVVYNSTPANGLSFRTNGNISRAVLDAAGNFGIGDDSPNSKLHVSRGLSGAVYNGTAAVIIEDDAASYLQFANPSTSEAGLLSGTDLVSIRGGFIFRADSSVQIRSGGNITRIAILANGNTGIGTTSPVARLDVNGSLKISGTATHGGTTIHNGTTVHNGITTIGLYGTALSEIIKATIPKDVPAMAAHGGVDVTFSVPLCYETSTVYISPENDLPPSIVIAYARVSSSGTVKVRFTNTSSAPNDPPSMNYYITVIR